MFKQYRQIIKQYPQLPLKHERNLIRLAKRGDTSAQQTLLLHQIGYFVFRIRTVLNPSVVREFGEDILQECLLWTPKKIQSYNLRYRNKRGVFQPVLLRSYIWKGITGVIFQYVKKNNLEIAFSSTIDTAQIEDGLDYPLPQTDLFYTFGS
jgi:hypothetical protein